MKIVSKDQLSSLKSVVRHFGSLEQQKRGIDPYCPEWYHIKGSVSKRSIPRPFFPLGYLIYSSVQHTARPTQFFKMLIKFTDSVPTISKTHYRWCSLWQAFLQSILHELPVESHNWGFWILASLTVRCCWDTAEWRKERGWGKRLPAPF